MFASFQRPDLDGWYRIPDTWAAETEIPIPVRIADILDFFSSIRHSSHQTQISQDRRCFNGCPCTTCHPVSIRNMYNFDFLCSIRQNHMILRLGTTCWAIPGAGLEISKPEKTTATKIRYGFIAEYGGAWYRTILLDPIVCFAYLMSNFTLHFDSA